MQAECFRRFRHTCLYMLEKNARSCLRPIGIMPESIVCHHMHSTHDLVCSYIQKACSSAASRPESIVDAHDLPWYYGNAIGSSG